MIDSTKCSNGLLVLRYPQALTTEQVEQLTAAISPTADALGVEPLVLGHGADARLEMGSSALLERVCAALERLVEQGEPPQISEDTEPVMRPALNSRPTGLNSRG